MTALTADDFVDFFRAVHGHAPFPWQARLARQVVETGVWPSLLDLPTGAGKTAVIDVSVFHLAWEAERGPHRRAAMRTLFVIDRRIVVDAAFDRARTIAAALDRAEDGVVKTVADRLRRLAGDGPPLAVARLRGGVPQERDWARSPAQPLVAVSTVDQAGSRLLFRGYGVSSRMQPVHAGLVGADALWLLDEVHLSAPLEETLDAIAAGHGEAGGYLAERPRLAPFAVVKLSATPGQAPADAFGLSAEDREVAELGRRLAAEKLARFEQVDGDPCAAFVAQAKRLAELGEPPEAAAAPPAAAKRRTRKAATAEDAPPLPPARRIAIVVNRVALARTIFEKLAADLGNTADVLLMTGRMRPLDRDRLIAGAPFELLLANPARPNPEKPIILVATQTIEAGADLDLDALVTQIAPLDCLRQRFGRLDRLGRRSRSQAVILAPGRKDKAEWAAIAALYGDAAANTAKWLQTVKGDIDFGVDAFASRLEELSAEDLAAMLAPRASAPVLLPAHAQLWATTAPAPAATPDPALFLHGPNRAAEVGVIWRADIDPREDVQANRLLHLCPPSSLEAMPLPIWAVRAWLTRQAEPADVSDVSETTPAEPGGTAGGRQALRWVNDDWESVRPSAIVPGDTLVVPSSYGGCDAFGWAPHRPDPVADLGTEAHYLQRRKAALRVTAALIAPPAWHRIAALIADLGDDCTADSLQSVLRDDIPDLPETWKPLLQALRRPRLDWLDDADRTAGFVLSSNRLLPPGLLGPAGDQGGGGADAISDRAADSLSSSAIGVAVALDDHLARVRTTAHSFAQRCGLDDRAVGCVTLAAALHDIGKADPRFQLDLLGLGGLAGAASRLSLLLMGEAAAPLAKSERLGGTNRGSRATPQNFRHEALSVALAEKLAVVTELPATDRDLVLWLIGTHHGHGRPFFPPSQDPAPQTETMATFDGHTVAARADEAPLRLDQGWFERADRLHHRFGPWELARLEAILRLADHVASAEEQEQEAAASKTTAEAPA